MYFLNSKFLTVLLSVFSVWLLFSVISVEFERQEIKQQEQAVEDKIDNVKQDNTSLEQYIESLKNSEFLKKEARFRLNFKESDEEVIFVHRETDSPKASSSEELSLKELPGKLWNRLFNMSERRESDPRP
ncbi:MAG: septum formation initiator family protein [Patescibacteria group bacterium]